MEVATMASSFFPSIGLLSASNSRKTRTLTPNSSSSSSIRASAPSSSSIRFLSTSVADSVCKKIQRDSLKPSYYSNSLRKRAVWTMVLSATEGIPDEPPSQGEPPPDLASYLFDKRIVYMGFPLVPPVDEMIWKGFLYLECADKKKPIFFYINSTGSAEDPYQFNHLSEALTIYDIMSYVHPPIHTLCVGNAWGEAAFLLAAGEMGKRAALPSATIMIRQPFAFEEGSATEIVKTRKYMMYLYNEMVELYATFTGKTTEQIEEDIKLPKYFSPSEAVEYGLIDKVLNNVRSKEEGGVAAQPKNSQLT